MAHQICRIHVKFNRCDRVAAALQHRFHFCVNIVSFIRNVKAFLHML